MSNKFEREINVTTAVARRALRSVMFMVEKPKMMRNYFITEVGKYSVDLAVHTDYDEFNLHVPSWDENTDKEAVASEVTRVIKRWVLA